MVKMVKMVKDHPHVDLSCHAHCNGDYEADDSYSGDLKLWKQMWSKMDS